MTKEQIHIGSMSNETAIGILKLMLEAMETYDGISPTPERVNAVKMAIEALENEPLIVPIAEIKYDEDKLKELVNKAVLTVTPQEPRWISVSERLPEKDGEYLLWGKICEDDENNYCFIGEYDSCAEEFGYWSDHYDSSTLGFLDSEHIEYHKVLAWMPLPKAYKEEKE